MRSLAVRVTFYSILPAVVAVGILCAAAGTVHFAEAWAFATANVVGTTATNAYFLRHDPAFLARRLAIVDKGEATATQRRIVRLLGLSMAAMFVVAGLDRRMHWSAVPLAVVVAAYVLLALGFFAVFLVFRENGFASSVVELDPAQRVVVTGPYRFARHPMYAGLLLIGAATPLALGSYWGELFLPPVGVLFVARLLDEERFLFGGLDGYIDYARRTRHRLFPGVW